MPAGLPAEEIVTEFDLVPVGTADEFAVMRAELDRFASVSAADIWAGRGLQN